MKYLHTFSVLGCHWRDQVLDLLQNWRSRGQLLEQSSQHLCEIEELLRDALGNGANDVAYYRVIMDGWNSTHRELEEYIGATYAQPIADVWREYIAEGLLVVDSRSAFMDILQPNEKEMKGIAKRAGLGDYAMLAYLSAFFGALAFVKATKLGLVVTTRCIGASRGDNDYT